MWNDANQQLDYVALRHGGQLFGLNKGSSPPGGLLYPKLPTPSSLPKRTRVFGSFIPLPGLFCSMSKQV